MLNLSARHFALPVLIVVSAACAGRNHSDATLAYAAGPSIACTDAVAGERRLRACETALRANPNDPQAHEGVGLSLFALGRYPEATAAFELLLQSDEKSFEAHSGLGVVLARLGRADEAMVHFRRAVELRPEDAGARMRIGTLMHNSGRTEEALASFRDAARRDPQNVAAWSNMAVCAAELQRPAEAVSYWQRILYIDLTYFDSVGPVERSMFEANLRIAGSQEPAIVEPMIARVTGDR